MAKVTLSFEINNYSEDPDYILQDLPQWLGMAGSLYDIDIYDVKITEIDTECEEEEEEE
ncbi:MAG: hypothetical protein GX638_03210 [Crenarchaeota archaeon]|nr:hypothetical protein [Thermoproteota archaeon]